MNTEPVRHIPLSVVTKPTGSSCNLDCAYCFFLSKELLYSPDKQTMSEEALENFIRNFLAASPDGPVTLLWQGGEPTLRGLPFFERAVELGKQYRRPTQNVTHAIQTNGTLISPEWAQFFAKNRFLVGVSIDGPSFLHDAYRTNRAGRGTHAQVIRGWAHLQNAGVDTNVLCTVHATNQDHPLQVYRYFRDNLHARFIQFIPIVERVSQEHLRAVEKGWNAKTGIIYRQHGTAVTSRSVTPEKYGAFLSTIFDEWIKRDVGDVFVQDFDSALTALFSQATVCVHAPECGNNLALEFNGDVYACDHWVEPEWKLGNICETGFTELVAGETMRQFSRKKRTELPHACHKCPVLRLCNGGCPKDRFIDTGNDAPQNYLCSGYQQFYTHIAPDLIAMGRLLQLGKSAHLMRDPHIRTKMRPKD
ncbi:anaerobic sulfatase maturase [Trueperella pecoris]|uniref:Anaerobic sulfatase maturase n=1 Tax=Trueperella pecoris TaxID=2733571 RepID=A0A7M1QVC4_9ACTO|nr:anaerobic sulfatase maturase [Trueperella pecoris]QOQ39423.1 anaerobic sulfatase maturase [Trueperella pecoris]QOR45959.1 anaerobic sulfatase maturase [Trueperella pecoris]